MQSKLRTLSKVSSRKGQLGGMNLMVLAFAGIALVVITVVLSTGGLITGNIQSQIKNQSGVNSTAYTIATQGLSGLLTLGNFLPTIATIVAAVIIIGLLFVLFPARGRETA